VSSKQLLCGTLNFDRDASTRLAFPYDVHRLMILLNRDTFVSYQKLRELHFPKSIDCSLLCNFIHFDGSNGRSNANAAFNDVHTKDNRVARMENLDDPQHAREYCTSRSFLSLLFKKILMIRFKHRFGSAF
jgi:hypothetical protein